MSDEESKPRIVFVHINSKHGWDVDTETGWTDDIEYILKSEYDKLKAENEKLKEAIKKHLITYYFGDPDTDWTGL